MERPNKPITHVVFTPSGAGTLREALRLTGRPDHVVALFDNFRFGPINPPDPSLREEWIGQKLGYDWGDAIRDFWRESVEKPDHSIVWLSRRSATEFSGYLEWLSRMDDRRIDLIDLTNVASPDRYDQTFWPLGLYLAEQIQSCRLLDLAAPLDADVRRQDLELWRRLKAENAPLRVIDHGTLISAPLSHFDEQLMSRATVDWMKIPRLVGLVLGDFSATEIHETDDILFFARVRALIDEGRLEHRGDPYADPRCCWVRLPTS